MQRLHIDLDIHRPLCVLDPLIGMLAATALVHAATLVTRNVRHVQRTGVRHLDPFADQKT
jgi:hypothetical protein